MHDITALLAIARHRPEPGPDEDFESAPGCFPCPCCSATMPFNMVAPAPGLRAGARHPEVEAVTVMVLGARPFRVGPQGLDRLVTEHGGQRRNAGAAGDFGGWASRVTVYRPGPGWPYRQKYRHPQRLQRAFTGPARTSQKRETTALERFQDFRGSLRTVKTERVSSEPPLRKLASTGFWVRGLGRYTTICTTTFPGF
jgi:hypothetical protein